MAFHLRWLLHDGCVPDETQPSCKTLSVSPSLCAWVHLRARDAIPQRALECPAHIAPSSPGLPQESHEAGRHLLLAGPSSCDNRPFAIGPGDPNALFGRSGERRTRESGLFPARNQQPRRRS